MPKGSFELLLLIFIFVFLQLIWIIPILKKKDAFNQKEIKLLENIKFLEKLYKK